MSGVSNSVSVSTKIDRIAEVSKQMPTAVLWSLSRHIDVEWLVEAYRRTRKDGAPGVDGQTRVSPFS
jgi:RNA-directed DNA polymerase